MSGVAVEHGRVAGADLTGVVEHDDLGDERGALLGRIVLAVRADEATTQVLDGDVLDVEADVVTWHGLLHGLVVHLHRLDLSADHGRSECDDHAWLDHAGLDTADWDCANTADLVDVLEWETERLLGGARWWHDGVHGLEQGLAGGAALLAVDVPALVPRHVAGDLQHVVAVPARDGHEGNGSRVPADLLDEGAHLGLDLLVALLAERRLGRVHLVDGDDHLLDAECVGEECVLARLTVLRDTGLEFTNTSGNDKDSAIGLRGTSDHVLDEISVARGIDDGHEVLDRLELLECDVDGDTTLALGLELVQDPGVFERALAELGSLLLELLDGTLVDTTALVDQVAGGCGLAGVDVTDDDNGNMGFILGHLRLILLS